MADTIGIIQATLAPIFLVSGAAIFLNFTQARLFRVVDRLRAMATEFGSAAEPIRASLMRHHAINLRRAIILRNAILFGVLVIGFTVATTLLLLLPATFGRDAGQWPIWTFAAALLSFALALVLVTGDAFLSVANVRSVSEEFALPAPKSETRRS